MRLSKPAKVLVSVLLAASSAILAFTLIGRYYYMSHLPSGAARNLGDYFTKSEISGYTLTIPKIGVSAPIVLNVDGKKKQAYNKALEKGVAQMVGSAGPGRNGNVFIFGHSSFFSDSPGDYKEVFKNLNGLEAGDEIAINSKTSSYVYRVTGKQIVSPDRVDFASRGGEEKKLTLMTCWPIGSDTKRLVLQATLETTKKLGGN